MYVYIKNQKRQNTLPGEQDKDLKLGKGVRREGWGCRGQETALDTFSAG